MQNPKFIAKVIEEIKNGPGVMNSTLVGVFRMDGEKESQVGTYKRNFSHLHRTFFHFRKNDKDYALYSPQYTAIRVMELPSCRDIGGEEAKGDFCPVDLYVPWVEDPDDGKHIKAEFGFVAGSYWGGVGGPWIQFLDLADVEKGIIKRDKRFGEIELPDNITLEQAIYLIGDYFSPEKPYVYIGIKKAFDIKTGKGV